MRIGLWDLHSAPASAVAVRKLQSMGFRCYCEHQLEQLTVTNYLASSFPSHIVSADFSPRASQVCMLTKSTGKATNRDELLEEEGSAVWSTLHQIWTEEQQK